MLPIELFLDVLADLFNSFRRLIQQLFEPLLCFLWDMFILHVLDCIPDTFLDALADSLGRLFEPLDRPWITPGRLCGPTVVWEKAAQD